MRGGKRAGSGRPAGAKNKRTVAVEAAARAVAERFKAEVPTAFEGDGVAYLLLCESGLNVSQESTEQLGDPS